MRGRRTRARRRGRPRLRRSSARGAIAERCSRARLGGFCALFARARSCWRRSTRELRAEGFRYLLDLVRPASATPSTLADPDRPRFVRNPDSQSKWGAENADNQYLLGEDPPGRRYRIRGQRESALDLPDRAEGRLHAARPGEELRDARRARPRARARRRASRSCSRAERPAGHAGNFLPLHPDARYVGIRQYFYDWEHESPAPLRDRAASAAPARPPALDAGAHGASCSTRPGTGSLATARFWADWVRELRAGSHAGTASRPRRTSSAAPTTSVYGNDCVPARARARRC